MHLNGTSANRHRSIRIETVLIDDWFTEERFHAVSDPPLTPLYHLPFLQVPPMTHMNSRREFLKTSGRVAAATTLISAAAPAVHAGEDSTIKIALVGCGGRGTGAALNALSVDNGPIQLVALADVFQNNIDNSHAALAGHAEIGTKVDVPDERKFVGFDAYQKAMDELRPGDVVILATPPGFRWVHYNYAIEKGLNVFMEKPVTVDAPTSVRMLEINKKAIEKNLKVGVGLMCRHCRGRMEMFDRIQSGEIGDIHMLLHIEWRVRPHRRRWSPMMGPSPISNIKSGTSTGFYG